MRFIKSRSLTGSNDEPNSSGVRSFRKGRMNGVYNIRSIFLNLYNHVRENQSIKMVKYIKTHIKPSKAEYLNTNNIPELCPYRQDKDHLYLSQEESLNIRNTFIWDELDSRYNLMVVPKDQLDMYPRIDPLSDTYQYLYLLYFKMSSPKYWSHLLDDAFYLQLSESQIEEMLQGKYDTIIPILQEKMEISSRRDPKFFVKAEFCSTKANIPILPISSAEAALEYLMRSDRVRASFEDRKSTGIFVREWKDYINPSTEFRVIVRDSVVVGVCQQFLYDVHPIMNYWDPETTISAFQKLYNSWLSKMPPKVEYKDCCFDGYINEDSEGVLIEINSNNLGWGPTGAGLWCWKSDPPPSVESGIRELRITSTYKNGL